MARQGARATNGRGQLYESVVDTIGNTPCVKINNLAPDGVNLYVKAEFFNPAGSVKDRLAISIIEEAEKRGDLKPGQTVVEATSGNTGIGLAMVCAAKGYPLVITMADSFSIERRKLMRFLGAKVVLTPRAEKGFGMYNKAKELADKNIAINAVTPAGAKTRILDQMSKEHVKKMLSKVPRGRFLELNELTSLVCWLSSEENSFSTAAVFDISGGRSTY